MAIPVATDGATQPVFGSGSYPCAFHDATGDRTWLAWDAWTGVARYGGAYTPPVLPFPTT